MLKAFLFLSLLAVAAMFACDYSPPTEDGIQESRARKLRQHNHHKAQRQRGCC